MQGWGWGGLRLFRHQLNASFCWTPSSWQISGLLRWQYHNLEDRGNKGKCYSRRNVWAIEKWSKEVGTSSWSSKQCWQGCQGPHLARPALGCFQRCLVRPRTQPSTRPIHSAAQGGGGGGENTTLYKGWWNRLLSICLSLKMKNVALHIHLMSCLYVFEKQNHTEVKSSMLMLLSAVQLFLSLQWQQQLLIWWVPSSWMYVWVCIQNNISCSGVVFKLSIKCIMLYITVYSTLFLRYFHFAPYRSLTIVQYFIIWPYHSLIFHFRTDGYVVGH